MKILPQGINGVNQDNHLMSSLSIHLSFKKLKGLLALLKLEKLYLKQFNKVQR